MKKTVDLFKNIFKQSLKPIPKITVSEWADKYRILSSESSANPGKWHTDSAPYQKEIMDAFTQLGIWKVVVKSASQIGKSDIMNNVIGRFAHLDPCAIMMLQPTIETAQDYSKSRIAPMVRDTTVLSNLFSDVKVKNTGNTILSKMFPGGRLIMCGSNSPSSLASKPIRILLCDEVDRFDTSAGTEGDPINLAAKRMTTFWNRLMGLFSTPTNAGSSRIEAEYQTGTREEWQHKCPNCGEYHLITHRDMIFKHDEFVNDDGTKFVIVHEVKWVCPDCKEAFTEQQMKRAEQKYIANNKQALANGVRSFFINCFTPEWIRWKEVFQEYLEAKGDPEKEKVVFNTRFGETYELKGDFEDETVFLKRREYYEADLPEGVLLLTAAVDVQDNRLEYEICGWGAGEECWGIKKGIILGVPDQQKTWDELDMQLDRTYYFANGKGLLIPRVFVDSGGHYAQDVYKYCRKNFRKGRFAIKGASVPGVPLLHKYSKIQHYNIILALLGVDSGKQYVMDRLSVAQEGPKYFHFPLNEDRGYDQIYFKGLLAEKLQPKIVKGRLVMVWTNIAPDKRNEPLDLRVYNLACLQSINPDWGRYREALNGIQPTEKKEKKKNADIPKSKQTSIY